VPSSRQKIVIQKVAKKSFLKKADLTEPWAGSLMSSIFIDQKPERPQLGAAGFFQYFFFFGCDPVAVYQFMSNAKLLRRFYIKYNLIKTLFFFLNDKCMLKKQYPAMTAVCHAARFNILTFLWWPGSHNLCPLCRYRNNNSCCRPPATLPLKGSTLFY